MGRGDIVYFLDCRDNPVECVFSEYWDDGKVYVNIGNKSTMIQEKEVFKTKSEAIKSIKY